MCYIVFISHSLHWRYIKIALRKYVIIVDIDKVRTDKARVRDLDGEISHAL